MSESKNVIIIKKSIFMGQNRNLNRIKILGLVMLFMFIATQAFSQKCKFDIDKKDPLSGEQTKGISFKINTNWSLGFNKVNNQYFVGMSIVFNGNTREILTPENTIIFKLANGEIITIYAKDNYTPTAQVMGYNIVSRYIALYDISEEDLQKIAASPLVYAKVGVGSVAHQSEFNSKKGTEFQNKAKCILQ